ncbi:FtsX-like permease family protein, partial [Rhodobacterales bacterium HKCCE3408]|nr:FtsX-like permease family protein [Rhodobacterales bacterium HKCCE3408]
MTTALRLALRDLRGGIGAFRIFLLCLALGVAAIAAIGIVREGLTAGMAREASVILGGDAELTFTYRYATDEERAFMDRIATRVSETVDFRSMAVAGDTRGLTQLRAVDDAYPLYGAAGLDPAIGIETALDGQNGLPGGVMDPVLAARLDIAPGDTFRLGTQDFVLTALLTDEPDAAGSGFSLGPRTIVRTVALENSGLLSPGTLFDTQYRLALPAGADLAALEAEAQALFPDAGLRWRDTRDPAPGLQIFVDRMGAFLVLVGLAGLAVGGVGISASIRAWIEGRTGTIATLRTLGASGRTILGMFLAEVAILTAAGLVLGLALGLILPFAFAPLIEARLPVPVDLGLRPGPLLEAALYGTLTAFLFALWPVARSARIKAAALYRGDMAGQWPGGWTIAATVALAVALIGAATYLSGLPTLALGTAGGVIAALLILGLAALAIRALARP